MIRQQNGCGALSPVVVILEVHKTVKDNVVGATHSEPLDNDMRETGT